MDWQIIIPMGSFIAGLTAFPHCALMCGPLFALFSSSWLYYHSGRIVGYTSVGALLGWIGLGLDATGVFVSLQHFSIIFIALIFLLTAISFILPSKFHFQTKFTKIITKLIGKLRQSNSVTWSTFFSGFLSALLPCGVLIPIWALAASTGSSFNGASLSLGFVLGTVPGALLFRLISKQKWWQKLSVRKSFRIISGIILLILGLLILGWRGFMAPYLHHTNPNYSSQEEQFCAPGLHIFK